MRPNLTRFQVLLAVVTVVYGLMSFVAVLLGGPEVAVWFYGPAGLAVVAALVAGYAKRRPEAADYKALDVLSVAASAPPIYVALGAARRQFADWDGVAAGANVTGVSATIERSVAVGRDRYCAATPAPTSGTPQDSTVARADAAACDWFQHADSAVHQLTVKPRPRVELPAYDPRTLAYAPDAQVQVTSVLALADAHREWTARAAQSTTRAAATAGESAWLLGAPYLLVYAVAVRLAKGVGEFRDEMKKRAAATR